MTDVVITEAAAEPVEEPAVETEAVEAASEAAVEIARIEAERDTEIAQIHADASTELVREDERISECQRMTAELAQQVSTLAAETVSIRENLAVLLARENPSPAPESDAPTPASPEDQGQEPVKEPEKPRRKAHRWI